MFIFLPGWNKEQPEETSHGTTVTLAELEDPVYSSYQERNQCKESYFEVYTVSSIVLTDFTQNIFNLWELYATGSPMC